jgi:Tfp pilus assembly protein PilN
MAENQEPANQVGDEEVTYLSIGIIAVIVISSVVIYGIGFAQSKQAASYQNKIAGVEEEIATISEVEAQALALGVQEEELDSLYNRQTKWSGLVTSFGKRCLKGVKFTMISVDGGEGQVTIDGTASSYLGLNKQVVALQDSELLDSVDLTSATTDDEGRVSFHLIAQLAQ